MVTFLNYYRTLFYCNVLGGPRVGAVSDDVERGKRVRPQAKCGCGGRGGGWHASSIKLMFSYRRLVIFAPYKFYLQTKIFNSSSLAILLDSTNENLFCCVLKGFLNFTQQKLLPQVNIILYNFNKLESTFL